MTRFSLPRWLPGLLLLTALAAPAEARGGSTAMEQQLLVKADQALARARSAWNAGDRAQARRYGKQAETLSQDVLRHAPRQRLAALLGGQAAVFAGDKAGARRWIERYRSLAPLGEGDPDLHFLRAFVDLLADENPARAIRSLQRMYGLNARVRPRARDNLWWIALSDLGRRFLEAGKPTEAARQFATGARIARRLGDRRKEMLMLGDLGTAYLRADRYIEAAEVYEGLATLEPRNPLWTWRLGMTLANESRFAEAIPVYRKVLALQAEGVEIPRSHAAEMAELPLRLGNCLRHVAGAEPDAAKRERLLTEAEQQIRRYIAAKPKDFRGHKWLGVLMQDQREKPYEALASFQRAFGIDPMCEGVLRRMVQIHARHPAPKGTAADAWKATGERLRKDLEEGADRRETEMERRKKAKADTGCG